MRQLGTHLAGAGLGDNVTFLWNAWWFREAIGSTRTPLFFSPDLFAPFGVNLVLHTHTAFAGILGATLLRPIPLVAAFNLLVLGSLFANALAAYALAYDQTRHREASIVAAVVFAGSPFVMAHLHGHFNLVAAWGLPLFALCLARAVRTDSVRAASFAGLVLVAIAYSDYYELVYAGLFGALYAIASTLTWAWRVNRTVEARGWILSVVFVLLAGDALLAAVIGLTGGGVVDVGGLKVSMTSARNPVTLAWILSLVALWLRWQPRLRVGLAPGVSARIALRRFGPVAVVALIGLAPLVASGLRLWLDGDYAGQAYLWRSAPAGVDAVSLVAGNPFHPLWGDLVLTVYRRFGIDPIEGAAWLGVAPTLLAALVLARWRTLDADTRRWTVIGGVFLVWALGPFFVCAGINTGVLLPTALVRYVPVVANARIPGRAMVMVYLVLGLLAARAVASPAGPRRSTLWPLAVACLVLVDFWAAPFPTTELHTPKLYETLRDLPGERDGVVCELPLGIRDGFGEIGRLDPRVLYFQTIHRHPLAGGFVARLSPRLRTAYVTNPVFGPLLRLSQGEVVTIEPSIREARTRAAAELRSLGIRYVVLNRDTAPAALVEYVERVLPLQLMLKDHERELYTVESAPAR